MKTTKTWKQKTKSVGLATIIGGAVAFAGIGGSATPAAAQENNRICVNLDDNGDFTHFYKRRKETSCGRYQATIGTSLEDFSSPTGDNSICENFTATYLPNYGTNDVCFDLTGNLEGATDNWEMCDIAGSKDATYESELSCSGRTG